MSCGSGSSGRRPVGVFNSESECRASRVVGVADSCRRSYRIGMPALVSFEERQVRRGRGRRTLVPKRAVSGARGVV